MSSPIAVTNASLVRQHGPVSSRCPVSRQLPSMLTQPREQQQLPVAPRQEDRASLPPQPSLPPTASRKIIKRLPKASRECAGKKFTTIIGTVVDKNDHTSSVLLLQFSEHCLRHPGWGCCRSLATAVNKQLMDEVDHVPPSSLRPSPTRNHPSTDDSATLLAACVSAKIEEGDSKGVIRLVSSDDTLATMNEATFDALKTKHPCTITPSLCRPTC